MERNWPDDRSAQLGLRPERDDWPTITVRMTGPGADKPYFQGIVRIDDQQSLELVGGRASVFCVEPGEHLVHVHFRRKFRLHQCPVRAECSLHVTLAPREHVRLCCGMGASAKRDWAGYQRAVFRESLGRGAVLLRNCALFSAGLLVTWGIAGLLEPQIRALSVRASHDLGLRGAWIAHFASLTASKAAVIAWSTLVWCLLARWLAIFGHDSAAPRTLHRLPSPYFLEKEGYPCPKPCSSKSGAELSN
jgi:hypothetical protein